MNTKPKYQFWSERVYARDPVTIPLKVQRSSGITKTWTINEIVAELCREPGSCPHVAQPTPPRTIYGLDSTELRDFESSLYKQAATFTETYVRRGREHRRAVRKTTPIILVAVASYPGPIGDETPERRRWQELVLDASRERWGGKVTSIIAHEDEAHYHLHIVVHNHGSSVKPLHFAHAMAMGLVGPTEELGAGEAYREGGRAAQNWYHNHVGKPMGWERRAVAPRPRTSRSTAQALREQALDDRAEELRQRESTLKARETEWEAMRNSLSMATAKEQEQEPEVARGEGKALKKNEDLHESVRGETQAATDESGDIGRKVRAGFRSLRAR